MAELAATHDRYPHELLDYPNAAHAIGALMPYYPGFSILEALQQIGAPNLVADSLALALQWPKLLAFLRN